MAKPETPDCVVYKVQNQFKYWFDDENPVLIQAGLFWWQARELMHKMNHAPGLPLNPSGYPQSLYKLCRQAEWDKEQQKRNAINLFGEVKL